MAGRAIGDTTGTTTLAAMRVVFTGALEPGRPGCTGGAVMPASAPVGPVGSAAALPAGTVEAAAGTVEAVAGTVSDYSAAVVNR